MTFFCVCLHVCACESLSVSFLEKFNLRMPRVSHLLISLSAWEWETACRKIGFGFGRLTLKKQTSGWIEEQRREEMRGRQRNGDDPVKEDKMDEKKEEKRGRRHKKRR